MQVSWTKRQLVEAAFGELALADYDFDISPEETQAALVKLDVMMATWAAQDVNVGYAFGLSPDDTDLDQDSGLPLVAVGAVYLKLAIDIAASKGKAVAGTTKAGAKAAYDALLSYVAQQQVRQQQLPITMPRGAGNKPWRAVDQPFSPRPDTAPLQIAEDGGLEFGD
jgi:tail accessory factor